MWFAQILTLYVGALGDPKRARSPRRVAPCGDLAPHLGDTNPTVSVVLATHHQRPIVGHVRVVNRDLDGGRLRFRTVVRSIQNLWRNERSGAVEDSHRRED